VAQGKSSAGVEASRTSLPIFGQQAKGNSGRIENGGIKTRPVSQVAEARFVEAAGGKDKLQRAA
jgi:hypothetical protein